MTTLYIYGNVGDPHAQPHALDAATLVPMINDSSGAIEVRINSGGGLVMDGIAIFNALRTAAGDGRQVTCYVDGVAASMAGVLALAGAETFMADNALMMIHYPWDFAMGDAEDLRRHADLLDKMGNVLFGIYAERTGKSVDEIKALLGQERELWMTARDALDHGFITGIVQPLAMAASVDVSKFGYRKVPEHPLVKASIPPAAAAATTPPEETDMSTPLNPPAADNQPPVANSPAVQVNAQAMADAAVVAERGRISAINAMGQRHKLPADQVQAMIADGLSVDAANAKALDILAQRSDGAGIGHHPAVVTRDGRDKWMQGAMNAIAQRSGVSSILAAAAKSKGVSIDLDPGEFRGMSFVQLAEDCLARAGVRAPSRTPEAIIGAALTMQASGFISQNSGDFPVLLENLLNKTLQSAYATTPDTWSRFCGTGSVTDFRAHQRYILGSFSGLEDIAENGEVRNIAIPDGAKESITARSKGAIISLTNQALVNDDMGAFASLAVSFGRGARLQIEKDVYAYLISNPLMNDGFALFSTQHANLMASGTGAAAPTVGSFDGARVLMASQRDPSNQEILDIRPSYWVGPIGLGGAARVVNGSQYDPNTAAALQRINIALGIVQDIVDTPRLSGTAWYMFADKDVAPAIEVAFLNGQSEPELRMEDSFNFYGARWRAVLNYGVAAINWRSAVRNDGA